MLKGKHSMTKDLPKTLLAGDSGCELVFVYVHGCVSCLYKVKQWFCVVSLFSDSSSVYSNPMDSPSG